MNTIKYNGEFTWDMTSVAPYAYWHEVNGVPYSTHGAIGSAPVYFFSKNHTEEGDRRNPVNNLHTLPDEIWTDIKNPNTKEKWIAPPYKEYFKNDRFVWEKPLLIINNKYTEEHGGDPVNYLSVDCLERIVQMLKDKYEIAYFRPHGAEPGYSKDDNILMPLRDQNFPVKYLWMLDPGTTPYNELQFMLHANCSRFISVSGANSVICSYFGGENLIYRSPESKWNYPMDFNKFSGAKVELFYDYDSLIKKAEGLWL